MDLLCVFLFFFFFKQKTAYEILRSDWSSDVCSSDLQARKVAEALGVWKEGMDASTAALAVADRLEGIYEGQGIPTQVRQLEIPQDDLTGIARETVKNFNANREVRSPEGQVDDALRLLQAAW